MFDVTRKRFADSIINDIATVQPMSKEVGEALSFLMTFKSREPIQGERFHDISRGFLRYYGDQYIPEYLWIKIKISGY